MTSHKPSGVKTIFWWVVWITLTIVSFFVAAWFWTPIIARHVGPVSQNNASILWVAAVFGTWMLFLIPLIIIMYSKVDKAYDDARMKREKAERRFKSILLPKEQRTLPPALGRKLDQIPETIESGHLVTVILKNDKRFPYVFIQGRNEIVGIYDQPVLPFSMSEIKDIEPDHLDYPPKFMTTRWLRLDGVQAE